ncbi:glutaminase A [Sedimentibacter sp. zth1]|uniref:glutaminase A n=1 Tax=Sedimentibacter sp. zth1 TaxID=2816908 RepID=UPI001A936FEE|nr:glutaminase A [Sedimentibacter sp. zth1]QSX05812.1 glutaminase A [Sedimentibacter sp. zth1]
MNKTLNTILESSKIFTQEGNVATYIPELSKANPNNLGICVVALDGKEYYSGDYDKKFTMQSISKIITLMLALMDNGEEKVFSYVGAEPTGDSFNSIANLEVKNIHKPYNPMINAGAIMTTSLIIGQTIEEKIGRILDFTRKLSNNNDISIDQNTYFSEKETGDRNRSLAYFMKSYNSMQGKVDDILEIYFQQCSIEVSCIDLARIGAVLANDGVLPWSGERVISKHICRITKTIMVTCGLYDASGEFAIHIGIPAKSGVGGGILGAVPKEMGIGVFGPSLDAKGNSIAGIQMMQKLSKKLNLNIF